MTRYSKYDMTMVDAADSAANQRNMSCLSIIRNEEGYFAYQVSPMKLDFTKQEKSEEHISTLLGQLADKARLLLTNQTCFEH